MSTKNLMTSMEAVTSNKSSITKLSYRQIGPDRGISGSDFPNGDVIYRFSVSGNNWWIPSKSYLSLRSNLYSTGTTQPSLTSDMAPAVDYTACLFQAAEMRLDDRPMSRVTSFLPQIDALKTRTSRSKAWRDSIGKSTNYWEIDHERRKAAIVSDVIADHNEVVEEKIQMTGTSIAISTSGVLTGVATALSAELAVGDVLAVNGVHYQVTTAPTDATGTTSVVTSPVTAVPASTDFYKLYRRTPTTYAQRDNTVETIWVPPLAIFDVSTPLPPGSYELRLTPNTSNYKNAAVESVGAALTTQDVYVDNMYFNACVVESENIPDNFTYYLDMNEIAFQSKALNATASEQTLDVTVPATTYAISVACQQKAAGSSTLYSPTKFKLQSNEDLNLTQLRLTYSGQTSPSPDYTVTYDSGTDHLTRVYANGIMNAHGYNNDVLESKDEWLDMGWIHHATFMKPRDDASTRLDLSLSFGTGAPTSANALVFAHHSQVLKVDYSAGRVSNVRLELA